MPTPIDRDDPRLTALALGELDELEKQALESEISGDAETLAMLLEIQATAELLKTHLAAEQHRETAARSEPALVLAARQTRRSYWIRGAIAAGLLGLAASLLFLQNLANPEPRLGLAVVPESSVARAPLAAPKAEAGGVKLMPAPVAPAAESAPAPLAAAPGEPGIIKDELAAKIGETTIHPPTGKSMNDNVQYYTAAPGLVPAKPGAASTPVLRVFERGNLESKSKGMAPAAPAVRSSKLSQFGLATAGGESPKLGKPVEVVALADNDSKKRDLNEFKREELGRLREREQPGGDAFQKIVDNAFVTVAQAPLSTFSIDVDTASYANVRKFLNQGARPPADAVRIEELVNYFPYHYPAPKGDDPFSVDVEVARCPWMGEHRLVRVGLKGKVVEMSKRPPSNLVFLIDVSGSMLNLDKLPLLKAGMKLLVDQLGENDRVAIVTYAGREGLALPSTPCDRKGEILSTLEQLEAGGSTNGGQGIQLAYDVAVQNFIKGGTNRVILATDGDFNVGVTEGPDLDRLIEQKRTTGVFLSVLGFGAGNVKHDKLERLADLGNGQYCFIDAIGEARKVLVEQVGGTLMTIAKDVKIQVEFNPTQVASYRLIGYENRALEARDFDDDRKDAGEIGSGHTVTALYEVVSPAQLEREAGAQALRYKRTAAPAAEASPELLAVKLRYKAPDGDVSKLITVPVIDTGKDFANASVDFKFAAAVAGFGMLLRDSPHKGNLTWPALRELAGSAVGDDPGGYRKEFLELIPKAEAVTAR